MQSGLTNIHFSNAIIKSLERSSGSLVHTASVKKVVNSSGSARIIYRFIMIKESNVSSKLTYDRVHLSNSYFHCCR